MEQRSVRSPGWNGTWEALPPKRRRFFFWAFLWVVILDTACRALLELAGVPGLAASVLTIAGGLVQLVPLGRAAWEELVQRRARGEEPQPRPMTRRRLTAWAVWTVISWAGFTAVVIWEMRPLFPALPLFLTIITVLGVRQRRRENRSTAAGREADGTGSEAGER